MHIRAVGRFDYGVGEDGTGSERAWLVSCCTASSKLADRDA